MDVKSTTEEKVPIAIAPKTSTGKDASLDGKAVLSIVQGGATAEAGTDQEISDWATAHPAGAAGDPDAGTTLVGFLKSEDSPGQSQWKIDGDPDLTDAVGDITDGGLYTYNLPEASNFGLVAGAAVPK